MLSPFRRQKSVFLPRSGQSSSFKFCLALIWWSTCDSASTRFVSQLFHAIQNLSKQFRLHCYLGQSKRNMLGLARYLDADLNQKVGGSSRPRPTSYPLYLCSQVRCSRLLQCIPDIPSVAPY
jgi:hypothetical protein